jgi:phosphoribosylanthranilate isomerase
VKTRIKYCGLTLREQVAEAISAGADAVGFVLFSKSKRFVNLERLKGLTEDIPAFVTPVLLFVNPSAEFVRAALQAVPRATLQFHGGESPEFCASFGAPWIKAVSFRTRDEFILLADRYSQADALLVDTPTEDWGGSGRTFDWDTIGEAPVPLILAGGLNPENVGEAIARVHPFAVDVSSGIETAPGVKDSIKMQLFARCVQKADLSS